MDKKEIVKFLGSLPKKDVEFIKSTIVSAEERSLSIKQASFFAKFKVGDQVKFKLDKVTRNAVVERINKSNVRVMVIETNEHMSVSPKCLYQERRPTPSRQMAL